MSIEFAQVLVARHNALLEYYHASENLLALRPQDPSRIAKALGAEKEVYERAQRRFLSAQALVANTLENRNGPLPTDSMDDTRKAREVACDNGQEP